MLNNHFTKESDAGQHARPGRYAVDIIATMRLVIEQVNDEKEGQTSQTWSLLGGPKDTTRNSTSDFERHIVNSRIVPTIEGVTAKDVDVVRGVLQGRPESMDIITQSRT